VTYMGVSRVLCSAGDRGCRPGRDAGLIDEPVARDRRPSRPSPRGGGTRGCSRTPGRGCAGRREPSTTGDGEDPRAREDERAARGARGGHAHIVPARPGAGQARSHDPDAPAAPVAPHVTRAVTSCHPDAPSGAGGATSEVCVRPPASVARTVRRCSPAVASHAYDHCRHVSGPTVSASVAGRHAPSSTRTSTAAIPVCCAQATPATVTGPDGTPAPARGVSTRDASLIGPRSDQPRVDQYATSSANVVTLSSVTHLVADTYPYRPGTTRRAGNPCAGGSGSPFMPTASRHARSGSVSTSSGVLAVHPS